MDGRTDGAQFESSSLSRQKLSYVRGGATRPWFCWRSRKTKPLSHLQVPQSSKDGGTKGHGGRVILAGFRLRRQRIGSGEGVLLCFVDISLDRAQLMFFASKQAPHLFYRIISFAHRLLRTEFLLRGRRYGRISLKKQALQPLKLN